MSFVAPLLPALLLGSATRAYADNPPPASITAAPGSPPPEKQDRASEGVPSGASATRRSGFTFGFESGLSLGAAEGYPNDFSKMDNPAYRARAAGFGGSFTLWIGGALTDWFTFGFGLGGGSFGGSIMSSEASTFLFHLESFPLFSLGDRWRDIGVFADFGTGSAFIHRKRDKAEMAAAGAPSIAGIGAFWEAWRVAGGHLTAGPVLSWQYQESDSMVRYFGTLGLRGAFYGGP
jgi:hypothetical protein